MTIYVHKCIGWWNLLELTIRSFEPKMLQVQVQMATRWSKEIGVVLSGVCRTVMKQIEHQSYVMVQHTCSKHSYNPLRLRSNLTYSCSDLMKCILPLMLSLWSEGGMTVHCKGLQDHFIWAKEEEKRLYLEQKRS